jgi:hypothetical protein
MVVIESGDLAPAAVAERYMDGHDVGGPLLAESIAGDTCAVEAVQWAHKPDLVLEGDARRVAYEPYLWWSFSVRHSDSLRQLTSSDVAYR